MPHIFRLHKGAVTNILDWKPSNIITTGDLKDIVDQTDVGGSSAGSSIPTPIARMFLYKTAFELVGNQIYNRKPVGNTIYAMLVSETLDLLEMLYLNGANQTMFRYEKWVFDRNNKAFFGAGTHHGLLFESFKQAAAQEPFSGSQLEITLIFYKEGNKEVLIGGTSPFTIVFLSPNFKRKLIDRNFKALTGLSSHEHLFSNKPKQLHERDTAFISYIQTLVAGAGASFDPLKDYITWSKDCYQTAFEGEPAILEDISYGSNMPLVAGNIHIKKISDRDKQIKVSLYSDFKMDLPPNSPYSGRELLPLFLFSNMNNKGQYTSPSNHWSNKTVISALVYGEKTLEAIKNRELPGAGGIRYPFFSRFDFFEKSLVMLPGYTLDDERFETLIDDQDFILPVKPIFFNLFPIQDIRKYIKVTRSFAGHGKRPEVTVELTIPITGPTMGKRNIIVSQTYKKDPQTNTEEDRDKYPFTEYRGTLGIFPFIHTDDADIKFTNNYTIASYEKTTGGDVVNDIAFYENNGISKVSASTTKRSEYNAVSTRSNYYQVNGSFGIIQVNFNKFSEIQGGIIIPKFQEVTNGRDNYIYAIDFGTSNTHIEYSRIENDQAVGVMPFEITEINNKGMVMTMLNKPTVVKEQDGAAEYKDYVNKKSFGPEIDSVRVITMREFVPFQIGPKKSRTAEFPAVNFPFRTAMFESSKPDNPQLFLHSNIGFNIDRDVLVYNQGYQTNIKWQLESSLTDTEKQNRVKMFFRQLLLMIRSHALLLSNTAPNRTDGCNINTVKIAMSYPMSMDSDLKGKLAEYFEGEMNTVFKITGDGVKERLVEVTESIAPYYKLLKQNINIKHDIYCNIDVGGGTSDIVLVKYGADDAAGAKQADLLTCYCNSVMFAGKQLWGGIADDYNPDENGFVTFYLKLLQKRNANAYTEIQTIINSRNIRTEDLVSYLFNYEPYKFEQIFSECRELKLPLLLHYSALLYYIAKCCKRKGIALPKTLSFSGKGSEYIGIIFNNRDHLKSFTAKALSLFSGLPVSPEFNIPQTTNPKAITAQGSVLYGAKPLLKKEEDLFGAGTKSASDEPQIFPVKDEYHGLLDTDTDIVTHNYGDFRENMPAYASVIHNAAAFLDVFFGDADLVRGSERALNINNLGQYKAFFTGNNDLLTSGPLRNSFKTALDDKSRYGTADDSPFFFPFKSSLIELSKQIAGEAIKTKGL
ncbi:MAG: hypothetical protein EOP46_02690 [Sphingobacteriaceae bacterium]|nr:MAG: hypothetical protein EOP46_02690 [Sphingobacteriaceae bacterium]